MKKVIYSIAILLWLTGCLSSSNDFKKGEKQLINMGYTDIRNTGYESFCCAEDDSFSTGFVAIDKDGNEVTGCICSSLFKGITIRFN